MGRRHRRGGKWLLAPRGTACMSVSERVSKSIIPHAANWYGGRSRGRRSTGCRCGRPRPRDVSMYRRQVQRVGFGSDPTVAGVAGPGRDRHTRWGWRHVCARDCNCGKNLRRSCRSRPSPSTRSGEPGFGPRSAPVPSGSASTCTTLTTIWTDCSTRCADSRSEGQRAAAARRLRGAADRGGPARMWSRTRLMMSPSARTSLSESESKSRSRTT